MRGTDDPTVPVRVDDDLASEFAALGVTVLVSPQPEQEIEVDRRNWDTIRVFLACQTQWRIASGLAAVWLGLDYAAVDVVLRHEGGQATLADLRVMERAALPILNGGAA